MNKEAPIERGEDNLRLLITILLAIVLTACSSETVGNVSSNEKEDDNVVESEVGQELFTFRLTSEKAQYQVGEKPNIVAELTYKGDDKVELGHGGSWVLLNTTNLSEDYRYDAMITLPHNITPIESGQTITEQYQFSGGTFIGLRGGNAYTEEEFLQMAEMNFPPGQYKIEGRTDFGIEGEDTRYNLETAILIEVVE